MPVEGVALVLRQDTDPQIASVDQIGQHEVDETVGPPEGDSRLGAVSGKRHQSLSLTAGEDDSQDVTVSHVNRLDRAVGCRLCCE